MKSLLQEGSSIIKAVEAAWIKVGMPAEFSVKVMRDAEKSFFGLATKNSAVISLCYDGIRPEKRQNGNGPRQQNNKDEGKRVFNHEDILEKVMRDTKELQAKSNVFGDDLVSDPSSFSKQHEKKKEKNSLPQQKKRVEKSVQKKNENNEVHAAVQVVDQKKVEETIDKKDQDQMLQQWSQPMTDVVMNFLGEIFTIMQLDIQLSYKIEGLQLQVALSKPVFEDADQEYKLYTSLAFLMIQKIKKEFRKKCKGYRVVFQNLAQAKSLEAQEAL